VSNILVKGHLIQQLWYGDTDTRPISLPGPLKWSLKRK